MVSSGYSITHKDEVPILRMAELDDVPAEFADIGVQNLDEQELGTEELKLKIWHVPPGDRMGVHGHSTQEEAYYILEGRFQVHIGPPGDTETHEVGAGTVFAASPDVARGYENIGEQEGRVLVVAAPKVEDAGVPEAELID